MRSELDMKLREVSMRAISVRSRMPSLVSTLLNLFNARSGLRAPHLSSRSTLLLLLTSNTTHTPIHQSLSTSTSISPAIMPQPFDQPMKGGTPRISLLAVKYKHIPIMRLRLLVGASESRDIVPALLTNSSSRFQKTHQRDFQSL
jgi:hypothetical protein